jgi:hypothetical protein
MTSFNPPIGEPPAVQFIGVERLAVDGSYQRDTRSRNSQRLIEVIASEWDWRLCTPLLVANRDGALYIIDGQHRWEAAKLRGDIQYMPCAVGNYTGSAEEAALFVAANRLRVRVNALDMWRAAIASGDAATVKIDQLCNQAGLAIARSPQHQVLRPGELLCTKALYSALRTYGEDKLEAALLTLGVFADQVITHSGLLFSAIVGFYVRPPEGFNADTLADTLRASTADEWTTHPALDGVLGANPRAAKLRSVIGEVMEMLAAEAA